MIKRVGGLMSNENIKYLPVLQELFYITIILIPAVSKVFTTKSNKILGSEKFL